MRARRWLAMTAALTLAVCLPVPTAGRAAPPAKPERWIVRFADQASAPAQDNRVRAQGSGEVRHRFTRVFPGMAVTMDAASAQALRTQKGVVSVEPDRIVRAAGVQTNPPIGLDRIDQVSPRPSRSYTSSMTGAGVKVYVIDSGINASHTDFSGRLVMGPNFVDATATRPATSLAPTDCYGHGTHVAAIAAGTRYGVAKKATVVPVKTLDCYGAGYETDTVAALDWVLAQHVGGTPAVVNLSLSIPTSTAIDTSTAALVNAGVTVVAAAGNASIDACSYSPARVGAALTVANSTIDDRRASDTNTGGCVDLFAPGSGNTSAWIGSSTATQTWSGTSMASPHVAGVAALVLQARPTWNAAQVTDEILGKATRNVIMDVPSGTPNLMLRSIGGVNPGWLERYQYPTVTGTPRAGQRLVANPGIWGAGQISFTWAWYRVDSAGRRTAIAGATTNSLVLTGQDVGQRIVATATGRKPDYVAISQSSAPTAAITA